MPDKRRGARWITQECPFEEGLIPRGMGPFLPIEEDEVGAFNDFLSEEIDSSYGSSICCCDFCYNDFKARWPDIPFRNMEFQTQSAGSEWLVDYSRIPRVYSPVETSTLRGLVQCPRCKGYGPANVYIFEHSFSDVEEIEANIEELSSIGRQTPFLLLENRFAQQVHAEIKRAIGSAKVLAAGTHLHRARLKEDVIKSGQPLTELRTFGPAPARLVGEGRFNHAGCPVTYVADRPDLAAAEIGKPLEKCLVAELELANALRYLDLLEIDDGEPGFEIMSALACSALLSAPHTGEGWIKQEYVFSRFVADCARSAGFEAIRYGSTKALEGSNYVILIAAEELPNLLRLVGHSCVVCAGPAKRY